MVETTWHTFMRRRVAEEAIAYLKNNEDQFFNCREVNWLSQQVKDKYSQVLSCSDNLSSELKLQFITEVMNAMQIGAQVIIPVSKNSRQQNTDSHKEEIIQNITKDENCRRLDNDNFQLIEVDSSAPTSTQDRDYQLISKDEGKQQVPNRMYISSVLFFKNIFSTILGYNLISSLLNQQGPWLAFRSLASYLQTNFFNAVSFVLDWDKQDEKNMQVTAFEEQNNNTNDQNEWNLVGFDDFVAELKQQADLNSGSSIIESQDKILCGGLPESVMSQDVPFSQVLLETPLADIHVTQTLPQVGPSHQNLSNLNDKICNSTVDSILVNIGGDVGTRAEKIDPNCQSSLIQFSEESVGDINHSIVGPVKIQEKGVGDGKDSVVSLSKIQGGTGLEFSNANDRDKMLFRNGMSLVEDKNQFELLKEKLQSGEVLQASSKNSAIENDSQCSSDERVWGTGLVGAQEVVTIKHGRHEGGLYKSWSFGGGRGSAYRRGRSFYQNTRNFQWVKKNSAATFYNTNQHQHFYESGRYCDSQSFCGDGERNNFGYQKRQHTVRGRFTEQEEMEEQAGSIHYQMDQKNTPRYPHY